MVTRHGKRQADETEQCKPQHAGDKAESVYQQSTAKKACDRTRSGYAVVEPHRPAGFVTRHVIENCLHAQVADERPGKSPGQAHHEQCTERRKHRIAGGGERPHEKGSEKKPFLATVAAKPMRPVVCDQSDPAVGRQQDADLQRRDSQGFVVNGQHRVQGLIPEQGKRRRGADGQHAAIAFPPGGGYRRCNLFALLH